MSLRKLILSLAAVAAAGACSSRSSGTLSVSAQGPGGTVRSAGSLALGNGITIDRVRVVVRKLELEGNGGSGGDSMGGSMGSAGMMTSTRSGQDHGGSGDTGGGDDGSGNDDGDSEVEVGPFLVDLTGDQLAGTVNQIFDADLPNGTFSKLQIKVGPVSASQGATGADAAIADMAGASVIVDGTVDSGGTTAGSTPFSFRSSLTAEQELETTIVVDNAGGSANVTLALKLADWFAGPNGTTLDPSNPADQAAIDANIRASLDFERDDDRNGHGDGH